MAKDKPQYIATTGIDFEGCKPSVRVEAGEPIPASIKAEEIKDLLEQDLIREVTEANK
jgi:hypothetical protein